jgi:hypothetical protein
MTVALAAYFDAERAAYIFVPSLYCRLNPHTLALCNRRPVDAIVGRIQFIDPHKVPTYFIGNLDAVVVHFMQGLASNSRWRSSIWTLNSQSFVARSVT